MGEGLAGRNGRKEEGQGFIKGSSERIGSEEGGKAANVADSMKTGFKRGLEVLFPKILECASGENAATSGGNYLGGAPTILSPLGQRMRVDWPMQSERQRDFIFDLPQRPSVLQNVGAPPRHGSNRSRKLKVLLIGHQFQVPSEGQAKACALSCYGDLELHVLTPERYKEAETRWRYPQLPWNAAYEFSVAPVKNAWCGLAKWYLHWYPKLAETLLRIRPDVVDLWEEPWSLLSAQTTRLCSKIIPDAVFIGETEQNVAKKLPPPFEWFRRYSLGRMDFLIGRNRESLEIACQKGLTAPSRVVGNGVDTALFRRQNREACRKALGVDKFVVGYAGRLVKEKGIDTLLEAVKRLSGRAILCFCGDGAMKSQLTSEPLVKWIGTLPREELPRFYGALDVLVLPSNTTPSWKEQFGRVIVEAQACGVAVVGSDSGAIPEVIGEAGMVFPEKDSGALASCLETLRCDSQLRANMALKGSERASSLYSWESIASQMRDVYLETAHLKRSARA